MSYKAAIKLAGAKILAFEEFGSYQGTWIAKVSYNGSTGFVSGSYGSCSGCDAFESEFGNSSHSDVIGRRHRPFYDGLDFIRGCGECDKLKVRVIEFGKQYLEDIQSYDETLATVKKNEDWDMEIPRMIKWLEENKQEGT